MTVCSPDEMTPENVLLAMMDEWNPLEKDTESFDHCYVAEVITAAEIVCNNFGGNDLFFLARKAMAYAVNIAALTCVEYDITNPWYDLVEDAVPEEIGVALVDAVASNMLMGVCRHPDDKATTIKAGIYIDAPGVSFKGNPPNS